MRVTRLTDEEFIARVRTWQTARRYVGAALCVLGIVVAVVCGWWGKQLCDQALESDPVRIIEQPNEQDVQVLVDETRFYSGLILGFAVGQGLWSGALLAITGFGLLVFTDRKSRLLLDCWDAKSSDVGQAPA
jgi:hypothetical protein